MLQFLQHDGYVETARAFAEEIQAQKKALSLDPNEKIEGINITDDEDANNRQSKLNFQYTSHIAYSCANNYQGFDELFWRGTLTELSSTRRPIILRC